MLAGSAGVALAAIAGCSSSSSSSATADSSSGGVEKPNLVVAAVPAVTNMGLFLAKQYGYFAAEGLNVTIRSVQSSTTAIAAQLSGTVDVTAGAYVSYVSAQARNPSAISWRILAEGSVSQPGSQEVLVAPKSSIKTIGDLRGKTVAANILDNVGTLLIQSALADNNVPVSSVNLVSVPFPDMAPALVKGEIDAGWFDEPFLSAAQLADGAQELFDTCQGSTTDFPISGYMVTEAWAEKYPRTAAAFTSAIGKGQTLADSNRADDEKAASTFIKGVSAKVASLITFDTYPTGVDQARLQRVADVMQQFGLLKKSFDMSAMMS
jgi:NitT/TauT family transport system substrate-binding protein